MNTKSTRFGACAALIVWLAAAPLLADPQPAAKPAPTDTKAPADAGEILAAPSVERLHEALVGVMKSADDLGYAGRYDQLRPVVDETFDLGFMAEKSVGRHWKKLPESDQTRWLESFERLITANYAGRFDAYSGEAFETLGEEAAIHDTRVVRTRLLRPGDDAVQLDYRLREVDGSWRIIDIYLNGTVSELALRRSEYSSVLKRDGFEKLLTTIDAKVDSLREDAAS